MRRAGFTLIEILIVVGIIVIMLATAVMSVASGRGAVQVKEATRGVVQLSRYAYALALLRQRPVVVTFHHRGKIEVRISSDSAEGSGEVGSAADPIYREVDSVETVSARDQEDEKEDAKDDGQTEGGDGKASGEKDEKNGYFYTRRVLDPAMLAKEDAEGEYEGVTFAVEVLGEDGKPLEPDVAAMRSLRQPKREKRTPDGEVAEEDESEDQEDEKEAASVSVTYEPNGVVNPHRIIVRLHGESEASEGFAISISRSGKATVGEDAEEEEVGRGRRRRRR